MDIDYNALFGLEEASEEAQESAPLAEGTMEAAKSFESEGEEEQEVAEPAEVDEDDDVFDEGAGDDSPLKEAEKVRQSDDKNSAYAAARRKAEAERDLAVEKAKQQAATEMDSFIASLKMKDASGKLITTRAEYDAAMAEREKEEADRLLSRSGLSREALSSVIKQLPEVQAATEAARQMTSARLEAEEQKRRTAFDAELKSISELDPTVKTVEDLRGKEYFPQIYDKIKSGYTLIDAFRLATYDDHSRTVADKAAAQVQAKAAGKAHMRPIQSRGGAAVSVPAEVLGEYRTFFPKASDAEIAKMYAREVSRK